MPQFDSWVGKIPWRWDRLLLLLLLLLSRFSRVRPCGTPQTASLQSPPSLGFSRQEHWSGLSFPSPMQESEKWKWSCWVVPGSYRSHRLQPTRLLHPWDFPGKSTGVGCHCLLQWDSLPAPVFMGFLGCSEGKEPTCNVGGLDSISGLGRSPGGGLGNPLQYSCL